MSKEMSRGDSKKKNLGEEIADAISNHYRLAKYVGPSDYDRKLAGELITLIGKAYADGMRLPGERGGRAYIYGFTSDEDGNVAIMPDDDMYVSRGDLLIALSGTGKEEE